MLRPLLLGFAVAALPTLSAPAATATPEEAARLSALFERYVGKPVAGEAPRATVTPAGEAYAVKVDLGRALAGLDALGFGLDPYTISMVLTPLANGTWQVRSDDSAPLTLHVGEQTLTFAAKSAGFDGTFDPKLESFATFKQDQRGTSDVRVAPSLIQSRLYDTVTSSGEGASAGDGTVTTATHTAIAGIHGEFTSRSAAPQPPSTNPAVPPPPRDATLTYAAPATRTDMAVDRLDAPKVLDLWAFLAAHPSRDSIVAAQDDLKGLLRAGLPYLAGFKQTVAVDEPKLETPIGTVSAHAGGFAIDASGFGASGTAALGLSVADLAIPAGQLPPWSAGLVPTALDLHVAFDGFHAAEAAKALVEDLDLRKEVIIAPEQKEQVARLFWPAGNTVALGPSRISTKVLDVAVDGRASLGPQPSGRVTVVAKGLDREIAALQAQAASDPGAGQVLGPLTLAKNLGKGDPDGSYTWVIAFGGGPLTVNGAPLQ